jgi:ketosteroid isomerase-like protein
MTAHNVTDSDQNATHEEMNSNEKIIRAAYQVAEEKDIAGWIDAFTPEGTFTDFSVGLTYRGQDLGNTVQVYGEAFPDMHRELFNVYVSGQIVVVQLALQGTHRGTLRLPQGAVAATGNRMDAPCCDVFELENGKIKRFDCYPSGTVIFAQLGILGHLEAALQH